MNRPPSFFRTDQGGYSDRGDDPDLPFSLTISIGLAQYQDNDTLEDLTGRADKALLSCQADRPQQGRCLEQVVGRHRTSKSISR